MLCGTLWKKKTGSLGINKTQVLLPSVYPMVAIAPRRSLCYLLTIGVTLGEVYLGLGDLHYHLSYLVSV